MTKFKNLQLIYFTCCLIISITFINGADNCDLTKCNIPLHYKELGCKQIFEEDECCPIRFDCPVYDDTENCHYNGKSYKRNEEIDEANGCFANCRCHKSYDNVNQSVIDCAIVECGSIFDSRPCKNLYDYIDDCCESRQICGDEMRDTPVKCYFEDKGYVIGEKMYTRTDHCYECRCDEDFDNKTSIPENSHCKPIHCGIQLYSDANLKNGCIPVYYENTKCCPIEWKCPTEDESVISASSAESRDIENESMKCKFGDILLNVGDKIIDANKCFDCMCELPPMAYCIRKANC